MAARAASRKTKKVAKKSLNVCNAAAPKAEVNKLSAEQLDKEMADEAVASAPEAAPEQSAPVDACDKPNNEACTKEKESFKAFIDDLRNTIKMINPSQARTAELFFGIAAIDCKKALDKRPKIKVAIIGNEDLPFFEGGAVYTIVRRKPWGKFQRWLMKALRLL